LALVFIGAVPHGSEPAFGEESKTVQPNSEEGDAEDASDSEELDDAADDESEDLIQETRIGVGYGVFQSPGSLYDLLGEGSESAVLVTRRFANYGSTHIIAGLGYRYGTAEKSVLAPNTAGAVAKLKHEQNNVDIVSGVQYMVTDSLAVGGDLALVVQSNGLMVVSSHRSLDDDYYGDYGLGFFARVGCMYSFSHFDFRLTYAYEGGQKQNSRRLRFSDKVYDINPPQATAAAWLGYSF
jgi:hypothetical protein